MTPEKTCGGCGAGIRAGAKFCPYCGTKAAEPPPETAPAPAESTVAAAAAAPVPAEPDAPVSAAAANGESGVPPGTTPVGPPGGPEPAAARSEAAPMFTPPPVAPPPPPPAHNGVPSAAWQAPPPPQPPPGWRPPSGPPVAGAWQEAPRRAAPRDGAVPGALWPVAAMFGLAGLLTFVLFVFRLVDAIRILGDFEVFFGLTALLQALVFVAFAAACFGVTSLLMTANRIGPGSSCVAAGAAALNLVFVWHYYPSTEVGVVLVTLGLIAAACVVTFVPDLRSHFSKPPRNPEQPTSITVVKVLLVAWGSLAAFDALVYFLRIGVVFSTVRSVFTLLAGLLALATAALAFLAIKGMLRGAGQGRVLVSVGAGLALLTVLVGSSNMVAFILMLALAIGTTWFTWLPADARAYFGDAPLTPGAGRQPAAAGGVDMAKPRDGGIPGGPSARAAAQAYGPPGAPYSYGPAATTSDERTWSMLAHLLNFVTWIAPLIIMLTKGKDSPTVRANAVEALNFGITWVIATLPPWFLFLILLFVNLYVALVVVLLYLCAAITAIVFVIVGAVRAGQGAEYRYPINIRMVR